MFNSDLNISNCSCLCILIIWTSGVRRKFYGGGGAVFSQKFKIFADYFLG